MLSFTLGVPRRDFARALNAQNRLRPPKIAYHHSTKPRSRVVGQTSDASLPSSTKTRNR
jgi:hypothetical protein